MRKIDVGSAETMEATACNQTDTLSPIRSTARSLVVIGASAGGLEALERLFDNFPEDTGAAIIVIQHLSPDHKSMMATLLGRHTKMEVVTATDRMELRANRIHLIPPGSILLLDGNLLRLAERPLNRPNLPINEFLHSTDYSRRIETIVVIMSGTGTDGTRGAGAIHEAGGLVVVQSPQDARFDGMPTSAIAAGCVDQVLPAEEIGQWIASVLTGRSPWKTNGSVVDDLVSSGDEDPLNDILRLLRNASSIQFGDYKPGTIRRRIDRRMLLRNAEDLNQYRDIATNDPNEIEALWQEILVSVTSFFRDPESFRALSSEIDTLVREASAAHRPLRIWSVGTSTGEEAYSLAILSLESCARQKIWPSVKVFATDVSGRNIELASTGSFPDSIAAEMTPELVDRYFVSRHGRRVARPELRQCIVFARHNALVDPPFTRIDLVSCRNMLIYLRSSAQERVMTRFQYALRPGGILFLGPSEMIGAHSPAFESVNLTHRIWRVSADLPRPIISVEKGAPLSRTLAPTERFSSTRPGAPTLADQAKAALLEIFSPPPALLLDSSNEIIHSFGDVTPFISLRPGAASLDVLRLLPEPLIPVANALLFRLRRTNDAQPQTSQFLPVPSDGERCETLVRLTVVPVSSPEVGDSALLVFETAAPNDTGALLPTVDVGWETTVRLEMLESELHATREALRSTIEEMEASSEELRATNEEMMASNEELQSANEELQSVNEELSTVNAEFEEKIDILNRVNADLDGLTRVAPMGTIFVDEGLCLSRYSPDTVGIFRLREGDVGRPLGDLAHLLDYPTLIENLGEAVATGQISQREVAGPDGKRFLVRILPYRLPGSERNAAVLSFVDITESRALRMMQAVLDGFAATVAVVAHDGRIEMVNEAWNRFAVENAGDVVLTGPGSNYLSACAKAGDDSTASRAADGVRAVLSGQLKTFQLEYPCDGPDHKRWFLLHVESLPKDFEAAVVSHIDVTRWKYPRVPHTEVGA